MVTFQKYLVYILSTILMVAALIFMPEVANSLAPIYSIVIGAFIGVDLAGTILKTKQLPDGEFKKIKVDRYIVCSILTTSAIIVAIIMEQKYEAQVLNSITMLSIVLMSIGAMYIGGLEGNKLVTGVSPAKEEKVESSK